MPTEADMHDRYENKIDTQAGIEEAERGTKEGSRKGEKLLGGGEARNQAQARPYHTGLKEQKK